MSVSEDRTKKTPMHSQKNLALFRAVYLRKEVRVELKVNKVFSGSKVNSQLRLPTERSRIFLWCRIKESDVIGIQGVTEVVTPFSLPRLETMDGNGENYVIGEVVYKLAKQLNALPQFLAIHM